MKVALAQLPSREGDWEGNLERFLSLIPEAAAAGADLILSPEMLLSGFPHRSVLERVAEPVDGPAARRVAEAARTHKIHVILGFPELDPDSRRIYNCAACFDRGGALIHRYHKVHRFANELALVDPGDRLQSFTLEGIRAGLLICYDMEFPEAARSLALQGAQLLLIPSANMAPYGHVHRVFAQARSLENHAFVVYCNRCGSSSDFDFVGESVVVDPLGRIVAEARSGAELVLANLEMDLCAATSRTYNYFSDRAPSVYEKAPTAVGHRRSQGVK